MEEDLAVCFLTGCFLAGAFLVSCVTSEAGFGIWSFKAAIVERGLINMACSLETITSDSLFTDPARSLSTQCFGSSNAKGPDA